MNDSLPLVSIITVTLNAAAFLREQMDSVDAQTYPNIEHVFVDGGSTDGTLDIIESYAKTHNVQWISEPDSGTAEATNKGLRMATGQIAVIVPADDLLFPWSVETGAAYLQSHPDTDIAYGDIVRWNPDLGTKSLGLFKNFRHGYLLRTECLPCQSTYFRRSVTDEIGLFDEGYPLATDLDFWLRATEGRKVGAIQEVLAVFRKHGGTIASGSGGRDQMAREYAEIRAKHADTSTLTYRLLKFWDRVNVGIQRRTKLWQILRRSEKFTRNPGRDGDRESWGHFLATHSVSTESTTGFWRSLLPRRSRYEIDIQSRKNGSSDLDVGS